MNNQFNGIQAIVYVSQTGHTKQYAELLAEKISLPAYELNAAKKALPKNAEIIYLGWLMAGKVKGYQTAAKHFAVKALCGVGMSGGNSQLADIKKANHLSDDLPLFYLQGGFELDKLHGVYKLMMKTMQSTVGKGIADKQDRTPEEEDMLNLLLHGGNLVNADNLSEVVNWYLGR